MKKIYQLKILLLAPLFLLLGCKKEEAKFNFDAVTIQEALAFENSIGSTRYEGRGLALSKDFCPELAHLDLSESYIFARKESGNFLPLTVKYYFEKGNDTIRFTLYEWDKAIPGTTSKERDEMYLNEKNLFDDYLVAYNSIWEKYFKLYGANSSGTGKVVEKDPNTYPRWKAELGWEIADKNIELNFIWIPTGGTNVYKIYSKIYHDSSNTTGIESISNDKQ